MFDLFTGNTRHIPNRPAGPIVVTSVVEAIVIALIVIIPVLFVTDNIPNIPTMMAFVAAAPAPPPPPPPPPAPAQPAKSKPTASSNPNAAPLEAPTKIEPEKPVATSSEPGVPGGVEGGVPGGVPGGILGVVYNDTPPPPPPPAPRGPVRIGGQLQAPALLKRVEPLYPPLAVKAHLTGVVILEATVDESGKVIDATVLRSASPLLDHEALIAVKQWVYSPLTLNGRHEKFVLTVTLSFNLTEPTGE